MKRLLTILLTCLLVLPALAQGEGVKKVAILEVVDREGTVSYGVKLQLRSSLTAAITQTPGYEAYDRVDMAAIFGEHDFQRTGVVNDEQIKKLGEMSGCDYVLITEVAKIDDTNLVLVAKVVNVTTARVESSADNMIASNSTGIRKGGQQLATTLFTPVKQETIRVEKTAAERNTDIPVVGHAKNTTQSATNLGPRSKNTRLMVEGGVNLGGMASADEINLLPFTLSVSWGWQLSPRWFVGLFVCGGGMFLDAYGYDYTTHLDADFVYGVTAKTYLSGKKKSVYLGAKLGLDADFEAVFGIELGYDLGNWSLGAFLFGDVGAMDTCFMGPVVCYNF